MNYAKVFEYLGYSADDYDVHSGNVFSWNSTDPAPTETFITDTWHSAEFGVWYAEHGGDPDLTRRRKAKEYIDKIGENTQLLRAIALVLLDRENNLATTINAIKTGIETANNFGEAKIVMQGIADEPIYSGNQLKTAIRNKAGSVDSD